jgi:hypothetical protein
VPEDDPTYKEIDISQWKTVSMKKTFAIEFTKSNPPKQRTRKVGKRKAAIVAEEILTGGESTQEEDTDVEMNTESMQPDQ